MRVITDIELTSRTDVELAILFDTVAKALAHTKSGSPKRSRVIASLQNISRARAVRHMQSTVPGF